MQVGIAPVSIGFILAIIAIVITIVLILIGQLPLMPFGVLFLLLALARLC